MRDTQDIGKGSFLTYIVGYAASLALTITAFLLVHKHLENRHLSPSDNFMLAGLAALAVIQLSVQLIFFMHLDRESKPRWNIMALVFAVTIVVIVVGGSMWIMSNLGYHHSGYGTTHDGHHLISPAQETQYIIQDEGVQR